MSIPQAFLEPDALVPAFEEKTNLAYALGFCVAVSAITTITISSQMQGVVALPASMMQTTLVQKVLFGVLGVVSSVIGFGIKWAFMAFFMTTVLQFLSPLQRDSPEPTFRGVFGIVAYSGVIASLSDLLKAIVILIRSHQGNLQTMQDLEVSIGLSLAVTKTQFGAFWYALLGDINPITIWALGLLAFWLARNYMRSKPSVYASVAVLWLVMSGVSAALYALSSSLVPKP
jgi:hypothetical protein